MIRFLHTSDWQLGIRRAFFDEGVRERYAHDRLERIKLLGTIASEERCAFMLVCGDVFESNQMGRKTILRALSAMGSVPVPVYLLPGNHDPLNEASIYRNPLFRENLPEKVIVLEDDSPYPVAPGAELIAAPWRAVHMAQNPLHPVLRALQPASGALRIIAAHGETDVLSPKSTSKTCLSYDLMRQAIDSGVAHYIALGDKHSLTRVDQEGRIWYSGTPEATAFRETDPGHALIVGLSPGKVDVRPVRTGEWSFIELDRDIVPEQSGVEDVLRDVMAIPDKDRCVLRLKLSGLLTLAETARLRKRLAEQRELFASFELEQSALHTGVNLRDIEGIGLTGFAASTASRLKEQVDAGSSDARDALLLLAMLTGLEGGGNEV